MTQVYSHPVSDTNELDANYTGRAVWHIIVYADWSLVCSQFVAEFNL